MANREAVIELEIFGSKQRREKVEAVIDTGFNGYLIVFFTVWMRSLSASFF